jgi:hypothetical protein
MISDLVTSLHLSGFGVYQASELRRAAESHS